MTQAEPTFTRASLFLLALGLLHMTADLAGLPTLKGLAAATTASPAPKVFSAVRGLETYSSRFHLEWTEADGARRSLPITPELYARLEGPYNRRNVYGAVLAFGPVLASDPRTRPLFDAVAAHALCGDRPLLRELGVVPGPGAGPVEVHVEPITATPETAKLPLILEAPCR